jgi:hypothetical protein
MKFTTTESTRQKIEEVCRKYHVRIESANDEIKADFSKVQPFAIDGSTRESS